MPIDERFFIDTRATLFVNWLVEFTSTPTLLGERVENARVREHSDKIKVTLGDTFAGDEAWMRGISFTVIPLNDRRTEVEASCWGSSKADYYFQVLVGQIEERWPGSRQTYSASVDPSHIEEPPEPVRTDLVPHPLSVNHPIEKPITPPAAGERRRGGKKSGFSRDTRLEIVLAWRRVAHKKLQAGFCADLLQERGMQVEPRTLRNWIKEFVEDGTLPSD